MHDLLGFMFDGFFALTDAGSRLAYLFAEWTGRKPGPGEFAIGAMVVASLLTGFLGCIWAIAERSRSAARQHASNARLMKAQADIRQREALIAACPDAIVVMGADLAMPLSYRGGSALLQSCLAGPDGTKLAPKFKALLEDGTAFATTVRTASQPRVTLQGSVVGSRAVLFLRIEEDAGFSRDLKALFDVLPVPVWIRDRSLSLVWANRAFLSATGSAPLEAARRSNPRLIQGERDLVAAAIEGKDSVSERRYAVVHGRRRALSVDVIRLPSAQVAGIAVDVTDVAQAEGQLKLVTEVHAEMLNHANAAIAAFGSDRRLAFFTVPFAHMWGLPEPWLESCPSLDEVLDRLREQRRLPEQRDFQAWKAKHYQLFESETHQVDEEWHVPGGHSVRVRGYPHVLGGAYFIFDDVSEELRLTTELQALSSTQRALLQTLDDAAAVFGHDGRLKMHNKTFASMWKLGEEELAGAPHLSRIASLCKARIGNDGVWSAVASAITSNEPSRFGDWGKMTLGDGRSVILTLSPLASDILVRFDDLSEAERFASELADEARIAPATARFA